MKIIYNDGDIIAVDKDGGESVHPSPGHESGAMTDRLARLFPEISDVGSKERPGVVHRLDVETSGVMVFARTKRAYAALRAMFGRHDAIEKTYLALVHGRPRPSKGRIETLMGKTSGGKKMKVAQPGTPGAARAVTRWETLKTAGGVSAVEFTIETGRTHQIRVAAKSLGCPIVGDRLYGDSAKDAKMRPGRLMLHAVRLAFRHPFTGDPLEFLSPPPFLAWR